MDRRSFLKGTIGGALAAVGAKLAGVELVPVEVQGAEDRNGFFAGVIDEVAVYDRTLSEAEVGSVYEAGYKPAPATAINGVGEGVINGIKAHWSSWSITSIAEPSGQRAWRDGFYYPPLRDAFEASISAIAETLDALRLADLGGQSVEAVLQAGENSIIRLEGEVVHTCLDWYTDGGLQGCTLEIRGARIWETTGD